MFPKTIDPRMQSIADKIDEGLKDLGFECVDIKIVPDPQTGAPAVVAKIAATIAIHSEGP